MTKEQQIPAAVLRRDDEGGPLPQMVAQHREQLRQEREATPSSNPRRFALTRDPIRPLGVAMEHAKTGPWVPWEDCEVLIRERDEARDEAERMRRTRDGEIRRLRSAHETSGSGWQPIATAPRMRDILVYYVNSCGKGRTVRACYFEENTLENNGTQEEEYAPAGWYESPVEAEQCDHLSEDPTHWMPLPKPPGLPLELTPERLPQSTWTCEHCARVNDTETTFNRCPFCDEFRKGYAEKASGDLPLCDCDPDFGCKEYDPAIFRCCQQEMERRAAQENGDGKQNG